MASPTAHRVWMEVCVWYVNAMIVDYGYIVYITYDITHAGVSCMTQKYDHNTTVMNCLCQMCPAEHVANGTTSTGKNCMWKTKRDNSVVLLTSCCWKKWWRRWYLLGSYLVGNCNHCHLGDIDSSGCCNFDTLLQKGSFKKFNKRLEITVNMVMSV